MSEMLRENGTQHQALKKRLEFDWMEGTGDGSSKCVTSKKVHNKRAVSKVLFGAKSGLQPRRRRLGSL